MLSMMFDFNNVDVVMDITDSLTVTIFLQPWAVQPETEGMM